MFLILQVATVLLVAIAMSLALAHALELPGKRRLDQETYRAVQTIYYPGFTYGGFSECLGIIALLALLLATPTWSARFTCTLVALVCLVSMHGVYWVITHPVNRFWLRDTELKDLGGKFFAFDPLKRQIQENLHDEGMWRGLRDRWEYSHVARAVLGTMALIALLVAVAL
jgi:hypothetical protein